MEGFVGLLRNVLPSLAEASRRVRAILSAAQHVWTDSCEGHAGLDPAGEAFAAYCDDRRFFAIDAMLGRAGDRDRPFVAAVCAAGGEDLLELEPGRVDVVALDYYVHHEWCYRSRTGVPPLEIAGRARHPHGPGHPQEDAVEGLVPSRRPRGLAALAGEYHRHLGLPMILGETNLRGSTSDRATFLKHTLEQCEQAGPPACPCPATAGSASWTPWTGARCSSTAAATSTPWASSRSTRTCAGSGPPCRTRMLRRRPGPLRARSRPTG
jgi:hypothetical protein